MLRVAELSVIHIHGILACSVSVFSLFAYSISTSSSFPEDFLKSSYLLVVVIFFFLYVKDRNQINQQQEEEKEGEREREGKKETEMSIARREEPFPLLFYPTSRLPIRSLWNIISSRDVTRLQPCSSSSSSSISPVRIGRKERKIREEEAAALERCSRGRWVRIGQEGSMFFLLFFFLAVTATAIRAKETAREIKIRAKRNVTRCPREVRRKRSKDERKLGFCNKCLVERGDWIEGGMSLLTEFSTKS